MITRKKRLLFVIGVIFSLFTMLFLLSSCDSDGEGDKDLHTPIAIAGTFSRRGLPMMQNGVVVMKHEYQFYLDGTVTYEISAAAGSAYDTQTLYGTYTCYSDLDGVIVQLQGQSEAVALGYTGERVSSADIDFYLSGANDSGELSGKTAMVCYYAFKGGTVTGQTTQYVENGGTAQQVTAVANDAFAFVEWSDGVKTPTRTDSNVTGFQHYTAIFEQVEDIFTVTYKADMGRIDGQNVQEVIRGRDAATVTAVPEETYYGFRFLKWSDGVTTAERTDRNIQGDLEVTALFGREFTVTYDCIGGDIQGETSQTLFPYGDCTSVTAVPWAGFVFVGWSDGVTEATRQDTNVLKAMNVTAVCKKLYTVKYAVEGGGRIEGETEQKLFSGEDCTPVKAVADEGYRFIRWDDDYNYHYPDFVPNPERQDKTIVSDTTYTAIFKRVYTIDYLAGEGGSISGETVQTVVEGSSTNTVTATADEGYEFVGWSDGGIYARRWESNIAEDATFTANFRRIGAVMPDPEPDPNPDPDPDPTPDPDPMPDPDPDPDGTSARPYLIETQEELRAMQPTMHYVLKNDIVLTGNFTPLFSDESPFNGSLDGDGHAIKNLTITNTQTYYTGLFACIGADGAVKNLTLTDVTIAGANYIGAVAGYCLGTIENCKVCGTVDYIAANSFKVFIGGIAGRMEGDLSGCKADIVITCEGVQREARIGGVVGYYLAQSSSMFVDSCETKGTITVAADGNISSWIGGVFGEIAATAKNCISSCNISASTQSYSYVGGLVGECRSMLINCAASGNISGCVVHPYLYIGGLAGYCSLINNCSASGDVAGYAGYDLYIGGLVGVGSEINDSYSMGEVTANTSQDKEIINLYAGGLIGKVSSSSQISDCYTVSKIAILADVNTTHLGGLVGYSEGGTLQNAHWLYDPDSGVEYAVGYNNSLGIPTSMGSIKHTAIEEFYDLADALNGDETPVWEHLAENTLPTLKRDE